MINRYPYTDAHELNLDYILRKIKEYRDELSEFEALNTITLQGLWDITVQYPKWSVVDYNGMGYLAIQAVPAGIDISNTDYWKVILDYSILVTDIENRLDALEAQTSDIYARINVTDYFKDKNILILGDSISDESISRFQPNWVSHFRDMVTPFNCTITNYSVGGRTLSNVDANNLIANLSNVPAGAYTDIILFMGVNDWQLNATPAQFNTAMQAFNTWVQGNYSTANVHVITPLKSVTTLGATQPLMFFRLYMIKYFARMGFNIIDAFADAPFFNGYETFLKDKWSGDDLGSHDGLHINPDYAPYFAKFVFRNMQTHSTGSLSGHVASIIKTDFYNSKNLEMFLHEDGKVALHLDLGSYTPGSTQTNIGSLPEWVRPIITQTVTIFTGNGTSCQLVIQSGGGVYLVTPNLNNMPLCNLYITYYPDPFERTSDNITL